MDMCIFENNYHKSLYLAWLEWCGNIGFMRHLLSGAEFTVLLHRLTGLRVLPMFNATNVHFGLFCFAVKYTCYTQIPGPCVVGGLWFSLAEPLGKSVRFLSQVMYGTFGRHVAQIASFESLYDHWYAQKSFTNDLSNAKHIYVQIWCFMYNCWYR